MILPLALLMQASGGATPPAPLPTAGMACELRTAAGDLLRIRIAQKKTNTGEQLTIDPLGAGTWPRATVTGGLTGGDYRSSHWAVDGAEGSLRIQVVSRDGWRDILVQRRTGGREEPFAALGWCKDTLPPATEPVAAATVSPFDPARWVLHGCFFTSPTTTPSSGSFSMVWHKDGSGIWTLGSPKNMPWKAPVDVKYEHDPKGDLGSVETVMGLTFKFAVPTAPGPVGSYVVLIRDDTLVASSIVLFSSVDDSKNGGMAICGERARRTSEKGITLE